MVCSLLLFCSCAKDGIGQDDAVGQFIVEIDPTVSDALIQNTPFPIEITAHLAHVDSGAEYVIQITSQDGFMAQRGFDPGTYRLVAVTTNVGDRLDFDLGFSEETVTFARRETAIVFIRVRNQAQLTRWLADMNPVQDIMSAQIFSGMVRLQGQFVDLHQLHRLFSFTAQSDLINAGAEADVVDGDIGVRITLKNTDNFAKSWKDCTVKSVTFSKDMVLLPKGLRLGMTLSQIAHADTGLYQTPDALSGGLFFGPSDQEHIAVYYDDDSDASLTLRAEPDEERVISITYQFEVY
jgi:hypothetical protein